MKEIVFLWLESSLSRPNASRSSSECILRREAGAGKGISLGIEKHVGVWGGGRGCGLTGGELVGIGRTLIQHFSRRATPAATA